MGEFFPAHFLIHIIFYNKQRYGSLWLGYLVSTVQLRSLLSWLHKPPGQ
jgi:hypothetical protein